MSWLNPPSLDSPRIPVGRTICRSCLALILTASGPALMCYSALLLAVLCATAAPGVVSTAAAQAPASDAGKWEVPRTPDGHPDLQGNWTNVTLTPFEREEGRGPVFTREEVEEIERPEDGCPANPGTVACGREDNQGDGSLSNERRLSGAEYNEVYWERGSRVAIVDGEPRTSLITHPANGRRPALRGAPPPSEHMKVTERFTRVDEETILYEFTVEDPTLYTEAWGGEIPIRKLDAMLYEYACHEGNYSLAGVLSGARYQERMEAQGSSDFRRD